MDLGVGDGTNNRIVILDKTVGTVTTEAVAVGPPQAWQCGADVPSGTGVYGRMQCSGTQDANLSMIAYGVGG
jgi:hypothetical protein